MPRTRHLLALGVVGVVLLAACADPHGAGGSGSGSASPTPSSPAAIRLDVYEALVRHLVDPEGTQPIYVLSDLCSQLMESEVTCSDHLSRGGQQELSSRLQDVGDIVFISNDSEKAPSPDDFFQEILLGPIVEKPDGLRVEGGSVCGGLCGNGAVYIVVPSEDGYQITGTDDAYGMWVA